MFSVGLNNEITITRGDSATAKLFINAGTEVNVVQYTIQDEDKIYLGIMEPNQPFEKAILKKVFTSQDVDEEGYLNIKFKPNDTVQLMPGTYYYSIKLVDKEEDVTTLISNTLFTIGD